MTITTATVRLVAAASSTTSKSSGSSVFLIVLLGIGAVAYFAFLRPQQQRAKQQREKSRQVEVGDEVLTVGGIVGRVVDVGDDRITIVSGGDGPAAPGDPPPTRLVVVRQGIARRLDPVVPEGADEHDEDGHDGGEHEDGYGEDRDDDESAGHDEDGGAGRQAGTGNGPPDGGPRR